MMTGSDSHTRAMAWNQPSGPRVPQSVYWRRRAGVFGAGAIMLALLMWLMTVLLGGSTTAATAGGAAARRADGAHQGRPAAAGAASLSGRAHPRAGGTAANGGTVPSGRRATPRGAHTTQRGTAALAAAQPPPGVPAPCSRADVVLSLAASRGTYGPRAQPMFDVYVVSVGSGDCSVNVGSGYLALVIKAGGTSRVWDSADCAQPARARFVQLSRGVPEVIHFTWDRRSSAPGCRGARTPVRAGTYTATAVVSAAHLASHDTVFVLAAPGMGMP